jgi:hypothetical protein
MMRARRRNLESLPGGHLTAYVAHVGFVDNCDN